MQRLEVNCRKLGLWLDSSQTSGADSRYLDVDVSRNKTVCNSAKYLLKSSAIMASSSHSVILITRHPLLGLVDRYATNGHGLGFAEWVRRTLISGVPASYRQINACAPCSGLYDHVVRAELERPRRRRSHEEAELAKLLYAQLSRSTAIGMATEFASEMRLLGYTWDGDMFTAGCKSYKDSKGRTCC